MRIIVVLVVVALAGLGLAASAGANSPLDPGCDVADLTTAIELANAVPDSTITLARHCTYTLTDPSTASSDDGLPPITANMTIDGNGARIVRAATAAQFRLLEIQSSHSVTINSLTLSNGHAPDGSNSAGEDGGAILNQGTLTLNRVKLTGNTAGTGGVDVLPLSAGGGGAIANTGTLTLFRVKIAGNHAGAGATSAGFGGQGGSGGGIQSSGPLVVKRSLITHNFAGAGGPGMLPGSGGNGGGLDVTSGPVSISATTITRNHAGPAAAQGSPGGGGGIDNETGSTIRPRRTKIVHNKPDNCEPAHSVAHCRH